MMIVDSLIQELKLCISKGVEIKERAPLIYGVKGTCGRLLCSISPLSWHYELRVVRSGSEWGCSKNLEPTYYILIPRCLFHEPQNQQHFQPKCVGEETSFEVAFQAFEGMNGHGHPQHLSASLQPSPGPITNVGQNQLV